MKRLHFLLGEDISNQLDELAQAKHWSKSGTVRVAINLLYSKEVLPQKYAVSKVGRPRKFKGGRGQAE